MKIYTPIFRIILIVYFLIINSAQISAQKTYSGVYTINSIFAPLSGYSEFNGSAKYSYLEQNEQRVYHGLFQFSTRNNQAFLPELLHVYVDSITISGVFVNGTKNGKWQITGFSPRHNNRINIEMNFLNGILDGPVFGSCIENSKEICSFDFQFNHGTINGPFNLNYTKSHYSNFSNIRCNLNFKDGLYNLTNSISYFNQENKEFKLTREYENGLLISDKFQDQSTGDYIINNNYNYNFSSPDFNYTNFLDFESDNYLSGKVPAHEFYPEFFSLIDDLNTALNQETPFIGYIHTSNSEIYANPSAQYIQRAVQYGNYTNLYLTSKKYFLQKHNSPDVFWKDLSLNRIPFVKLDWHASERSILEVNKHVFNILNIVNIFTQGQENIVIQPIKIPYLYFSNTLEDNYKSFREKYLDHARKDSINLFKRDSSLFHTNIISSLNALNTKNKELNKHYNLFYFIEGNDNLPSDDMIHAFLRNQINGLNSINEKLSNRANVNFISTKLLYLKDSTINYYSSIENRMNLIANILSSRHTLSYFDAIMGQQKRFQSQIQKLSQIPGVLERYNENRQFLFILDQTPEEDLKQILNIIKEKIDVYQHIYRNNIRINPKKYVDIEQLILEIN